MKHVFASILLLVGCGGDPLEPGSGSDPGDGTGTLYVEGTAHAEPREGFSNVVHATDFDTEFRVRITLNGTQVRTGSVTVTSEFISVPLAWIDADGGMWIGRAAGYDEVYQLDVISGPDEVRGVIVDGPDFHVYTLPQAGATLDWRQPLDVKWDRDEPADITTIRTDRIERVTIADTGEYTLAPFSLEANSGEPRLNTIELRRGNHIAPAGAIGGSDFEVRVENTLDVIAAPDPTL